MIALILYVLGMPVMDIAVKECERVRDEKWNALRWFVIALWPFVMTAAAVYWVYRKFKDRK